MITGTAASLINLMGFITGVVLYVMLLWMVLSSRPASNHLALLTGLLGFSWNAGAFGGYGLLNLGFVHAAPFLLAAAFSALCFLPAVLIHSALRAAERVSRRESLLIALVAYAMSGIAAIMHFYTVMTVGIPFSQFALRAVTVGFGALLITLLVITRGQRGRGRLLWVVAMSVFAVSALHLSFHEAGDDPWWLQLSGHHASLPLALVILYQDFRFALADIFLKRALAFILLAGLIFGLFAFALTPFIASNPSNQEYTFLLLALWVTTSLVYPFLQRGAVWFVDKVILKRPDYGELTAALSGRIDRCNSPRAVLDETAAILAPALTAESISWSEGDQHNLEVEVQPDRRGARVTIPTSGRPHYIVSIKDLTGGRRLLSDDIAMLERAALLAARGIDALRSVEERYRHQVQEQEMRKLAAEAELRALRAQINPHFLFNALTTIGYLIQTAPERALGTLMRLSGLLRGVLKSGGEFVTLGEELDLIEAYLDIERARFEDRLRIWIDVPSNLRGVRIPALVVQPLVENAIKHGVSECVAGGEVRITASVKESAIVISVIDTGTGFIETTFTAANGRGLGLSNIEQRLQRYGGGDAPLKIRSTPERGTAVEIRIPLQDSDVAAHAAAVNFL